MTLALVVPYCHLTLLAVGLATALLFTKAAEKYIAPRSGKKLMVLLLLAFIAADALGGWTWWKSVGERIQNGLT